MGKNIKIGKREVGRGRPTFIIAEMSGNHNHDIKRAYAIIDAAADAGADAVKLQTYTPDTITIDCDNKYFVVGGDNPDWKGKTLHQLYGEAYTPWEWQPKLNEYAESKGLICFSAPFDVTAVDFLEKMGMPLYKVASAELVDIPLLERIGKTKKPVIMSRGMASKEEVASALKTLKKYGTPSVALLHCVAAYPAPPEQMNLATIPDIVKRYKVIAGISDHSLGTEVAIAAVALGASIVEKHLTLRRADGGPDASFSMEPEEFSEMVADIRAVEKAIGKPMYGLAAGESKYGRKSLFVVQDMKRGEKFTPENVRSIRPGYGMPTKFYRAVLGNKAKKDISRGTPLDKTMVSI